MPQLSLRHTHILQFKMQKPKTIKSQTKKSKKINLPSP